MMISPLALFYQAIHLKFFPLHLYSVECSGISYRTLGFVKSDYFRKKLRLDKPQQCFFGFLLSVL